eukprot:TRINITY_DN67868_c4_g1_i4.p1 TRINITY_DN67868_c4_g1~~TRINITY_DN67868_c4_g1_i4.p1  ORF type:complete len:128 (+),score=2.02 TRINITY_DN67868_c4_g1_i4:163-546(+)
MATEVVYTALHSNWSGLHSTDFDKPSLILTVHSTFVGIIHLQAKHAHDDDRHTVSSFGRLPSCSAVRKSSVTGRTVTSGTVSVCPLGSGTLVIAAGGSTPISFQLQLMLSCTSPAEFRTINAGCTRL